MGRQAEGAGKAGELRAAVNRLPLATRQAMLEGIQTGPIIVGADGNARGGVCPLYATASPPSKKIGRPFARAWDRFAGARLSRPASERELSTLRSMLEASIERESEAEPVVSLHEAIEAHKASQARTRAASRAQDTRGPAPRRDSGERDRTDELSGRHGWAWLRPFRRYDEYERALQALDVLAREVGSQLEPEPSEAQPEPLVAGAAARD